MKRIQIVAARSCFNCVAIIESGHTISDVARAVRRGTVQMLAKEVDSNRHIEVAPFDFEADDLDEFDSMIFVNRDGQVSDTPSDLVQSFINDYFPSWVSDYTLQWKTALESYARDLDFFEDAFDHPSDFLPVDEYEKTEYEIMRFLIDTYDACSTSSPDDSDRNRRNYYFLRYPRLRGALVRYRQSTESS